MFDRYMQDKRQRRPLLAVLLVVAALGEGTAVGALFVESLLHVPEVEPPPLYALLIRPTFVPPPPVVPVARPVIRPVIGAKRPRGAVLTQPKLDRPPVVATALPPTDDGPIGAPEPPGTEPPGIIGDPPGDSGPVAPPPPPPPPPRKVPQFLIRKQQLGGEDPHLPQLVKLQHRGQTLSGAYLLCIDKAGHISSVTSLASIPGADDQIMAVLRTWTYKEQAIPVCFVQNFEFVVD